MASTKATSYTLSNLASATEYNVKVEAISATNEVGNSNSKYIVTLPDKVTKVKQERWYYFLRSLDVTWKDLPTADGYEVRLYSSKGKIVKTNKVSYNSTSFSKMKDEVYTVSVRAHMTFNGKKYYSSWSQKIYCMNQPRIKTVKVSSKKLKVTWAKVSGVTGYDVYVSTKKTSGYKKVKSVGKNTTKATITKFSKKKFSAKKTYYVYVVAKKKVKGRNNISSSLYYWNSKTGGYSYK